VGNFDELSFVYALTVRPEDCRRFAGNFLPEWLRDATLVPICREIFRFNQEYGIPPSIPTLRKVLEARDAEAYKLRYKSVLDRMNDNSPDLSEMVYCVDKARDLAIVRSVQEMMNSPESLRIQADLDGKEMIRQVQRWVNKFSDLSDEETLTIKEAIESLIEQQRGNRKLSKIKSGIHPIDLWTRGGVKQKNLGIIVAPSGHGKSAVLLNIAYATSAFERKNTWYITNELCMEESTERFLARIANKSMGLVEENPVAAYKGLRDRWMNLDERLVLTYVNRDMCFNELEGEMAKWTNLTGWKPEVIVVDYLERMKPNDSGYSRDRVWDWLGAIARDGVRLAKRHRILVWTAAQLNRDALEAEIMTARMLQSSIKHFQEAAVCIGVRKIQEGEGFEILEFTSLKLRQNRTPMAPMRMKADLDRMVITNITRDTEAEEEEKTDVDRKNGSKMTKKLRKYKEEDQ